MRSLRGGRSAVRSSCSPVKRSWGVITALAADCIESLPVSEPSGLCASFNTPLAHNVNLAGDRTSIKNCRSEAGGSRSHGSNRGRGKPDCSYCEVSAHALHDDRCSA